MDKYNMFSGELQPPI